MTVSDKITPHVVIIGAGFTGLSAAYELSKAGVRVTILESEKHIGGLAADFEAGGALLERFYHHWFTNDRHVMDLIEALGKKDNILLRPTRTGMYFANQFFRLSRPFDLLRFTPLSLFNRVRLGLLVFQTRMVKDWRTIEHLTAREWLIKLCGKRVFEVVWEPLLIGKFGEFADSVSAVWFWKKLALRGGSRAKAGAEMLAYYRGGFGTLTNALADKLYQQGVTIKQETPAKGLSVVDGHVTGVITSQGMIACDAVLATPALPIIARLLQPYISADYFRHLNKIEYLANVCLVLQLDRSLSGTYWLNVNDASFPFVGVIEHTNFEPSESYSGRHIVYLSKYLPRTHALYKMSREELLAYSIPYLKKMFPDFDSSWILDYHVWAADYAQPVVQPHYSRLIPDTKTPLNNFYIATMAQIYPEDRGTNYAIREGRKIGVAIRDALLSESVNLAKASA